VVIEVIYAAVAATCFGLGWCAKRHSCREHVRRHHREQAQVPQEVVARRVRPELPAA
jgi:hypothetical protein